MTARLKVLFHKMPDSFQSRVIGMVGFFTNKRTYFRYHRPFQKKVIKVLTNMGYRDICSYKRNTWKILPFFSQYYVAKNEQGKKCFCKFSILNDNYGCIVREADILKKLNSKDNIPTLRGAIPDYVDYVKEETFGLEGVIYQWLENTEAIGSDNIKTRDDIEKLNDFFKRIYLEMSEVGLIHVDIRPVNVLVDKDDGSFKLIDFGLSFAEGGG